MAIERLQALEEEMQKCFRCNLCKMVPLPVVKNPDYFDVCPANREFVFHSFSGSGKQIMALSLLQGRIPADKKLADIVFACATCGACDVSCKFNMDAERQQVNMALREHLVESGLAPQVHRDMVENLLAQGHRGGPSGVLDSAWARNQGLKILPGEKARVLLFAGCQARRDPQAAGVAGKLARLIQAAGLDVGFLGDAEPCCGLPAYWTGHRDAFSRIISDNVSRLDGLGVETVAVTSGCCLGAFRSKYPEYGKALAPRVVHATELLWDLIESKKLPLPRSVKKQVTYHDPCYLGRQSEPPITWKGESKLTRGQMTYNEPTRPVNRGTKGVYDAPRNILGAIDGIEFTEMYRIREYAFCCGGGGGAPAAYPEMARNAAIHRIDEARRVGARAMVTACHECRAQFVKAQAQDKKDGLPVLDIVDLVYEAAGL